MAVIETLACEIVLKYRQKVSVKNTATPTDFITLVDRSLMEDCREAGIKVIPWTVDDEDNIRKIPGMQVDGIISNYPDRVLRITRGY